MKFQWTSSSSNNSSTSPNKQMRATCSIKAQDNYQYRLTYILIHLAKPGPKLSTDFW
jgi:hypothetical protein